MRWKSKMRMMLVMLLMITFPTMNTIKNEVDNLLEGDEKFIVGYLIL